MTTFFVGLSLGLLINRYSKKPLLRFPVRCWFFGHARDVQKAQCRHCSLYMQDDDDRFNGTFWTA